MDGSGFGPALRFLGWLLVAGGLLAGVAVGGLVVWLVMR